MAVAVGCVTAVSPALADPNGAIGQAKLTPSKAFPGFRGRAEIVVLPYDAEVQLGFKGTPRGKNRWIYLWLSDSGKSRKAWLGGGFPAEVPARGISPVIPGKRPIAKRHARAAERLVVTLVSERRAGEIYRRGQRSGWRNPVRIQGKRIADGAVVPCPDGQCPHPPSLGPLGP
jgi:hypothetical protein